MNNDENYFNSKQVADQLKELYKDRVPIVITKSLESTLPELVKTKYLVPKQMKIGEFILLIRRKIKVESYQAIFIFTKNENYTPPSNMLMNDLYLRYKSNDDYLHLNYRKENTFGLMK